MNKLLLTCALAFGIACFSTPPAEAVSGLKGAYVDHSQVEKVGRYRRGYRRGYRHGRYNYSRRYYNPYYYRRPYPYPPIPRAVRPYPYGYYGGYYRRGGSLSLSFPYGGINLGW